jgi:hypothetical protein
VDLDISLKATPRPDGKSADVHALIPALSIDEPLGSIQGAAACTSWWHGGVWSVSCTPGYRTIRLSFQPGNGALVVERTGVASRSVPVPPGAVFTGLEQSVGVRDAVDGGCGAGAGAGTADVQVTTQAGDTEAHGIGLSLVAGGTTVFLGVRKDATACVSSGPGDDRTLTCDGRPVCMLRASPGRVDFACDLPTHGVGALFLPCGAKVRLPTGPLPRTSHSP